MTVSHQPILFVADDDPDALERTEAELTRRYGGDYRIVSERSAPVAVAELGRLRDRGEAVALALADVWMAEGPGSDLLDQVRVLHPHAKRALLIDWGAWRDRPTADAILHAMGAGKADYYVLKPSRPGEEQFHRAISEFLHEWSREYSESSFELAIIAEPALPRTHEIRDLLRRSGVPHGHYTPDSRRGEELLADVTEDAAGRPVVRLRDGTVLVDPTNERIVEAFGVGTTPPAEPNYDLVVVGAGPAGLGRGGLRLLGGAAHARDRARHDRRPGRVELADPQLPRVRARDQRRRARAARLPAGVGVRGRVRAQPRGRRPAGATARRTRSAATPAARSTPVARSCSPPACRTGGSGSRGSRR